MKTWLLVGAAVAALVFVLRRFWRYADPDVSVYGRPTG
jgi:hypothetical protein